MQVDVVRHQLEVDGLQVAQAGKGLQSSFFTGGRSPKFPPVKTIVLPPVVGALRRELTETVESMRSLEVSAPVIVADVIKGAS